jgi:pimeloyl-ACP methyl ester carboxylesterase
VALLDHLKIVRAHLRPVDGGGYALETALRHPDRVQADPGLVIDPGHPPPPEPWPLLPGHRSYGKEGAAGFRRAWLADPLFAEASRKPELRVRLEAMVASYNVDALLRVMGKMKPPSPPTQLERLPQVKAPTLVMVGGRDQPHMIQAGEEAATGIRGARRSSTRRPDT